MSALPVRVLWRSKVADWLRRNWRGPAIAQGALFVALLLAFLVATAQTSVYGGGVRRDSFMLHAPIPTPVLRFTPPASAQTPVVAVLAHGYAASKEIMSSFATDLAKQGVTVYTFDFPGHGASPDVYGGATHSGVVAQLVSTLSEVVDFALAHAPPRTKLVLLGYSLGTIAVGEYALRHPTMSSLQATVLVAGILKDKPSLTTPRNLLVLSGQFDLPGINDISRDSIAAACDIAANAVRSAVYACRTATADQRKRVILPGLDHISIVTAASTHDIVIQWLGQTVDPRIGQKPVDADVRLHWMLAGFIAALLAAGVLIRLLALGFRLRPAEQSPQPLPAGADGAPVLGAPALLGFGALAATLGLALLGLRVALPSSFWAADPFPFTFLRQQVSADVAIFFLMAGAALGVALWRIPRLRAALTLPSRREALLQGLLALVVTLFLMMTLGALSTYAWESLALDPQRLWRAVVYACMLWPFFVGLRSLLRAVAPRLRRPALADLGASLLVLLALVAAIAMNFGRLSYLGILLPIFAIIVFALVGASAWTRRTLAHPVALMATLEALLLAWTLAATLPLVA